MIKRLSREEVYNNFYNRHLEAIIGYSIDIKLFESLNPQEIVGERAGPIKGLKVSLTAGETLKEARKKLAEHIRIFKIIEEIERNGNR